jgi:hypothetical protein
MFIINGEWWYIIYVAPTDEILLRPEGIFTVGMCDDVTKTIYLSDELYGDFLKKVLAHETTHAAMFSYDVFLTYEQEELIADIIATFGEEIIDITNLLFNQIRGRH